jgi:hypothetical protein
VGGNILRDLKKLQHTEQMFYLYYIFHHSNQNDKECISNSVRVLVLTHNAIRLPRPTDRSVLQHLKEISTKMLQSLHESEAN